jgi:hypothetical protein
MVASGVESGAKFNNFAINNITLKITNMSVNDTKIANIPLNDGVYSTTNCLFGGYTSDAECLLENSGISVSGVALEIPLN